jgi:hypothetical protein
VGSLAAERAQLTCRKIIRIQFDQTYANVLVGRVEKLCPVIMVIVIAGDDPGTPIGL